MTATHLPIESFSLTNARPAWKTRSLEFRWKEMVSLHTHNDGADHTISIAFRWLCVSRINELQADARRSTLLSPTPLVLPFLEGASKISWCHQLKPFHPSPWSPWRRICRSGIYRCEHRHSRPRSTVEVWGFSWYSIYIGDLCMPNRAYEVLAYNNIGQKKYGMGWLPTSTELWGDWWLFPANATTTLVPTQLAGLKSNRISNLNGVFIPSVRISDKDKRPWWPPRIQSAHEFVFCHNDLAQHNIMIDPDTLEVAAIIDWEILGILSTGARSAVMDKIFLGAGLSWHRRSQSRWSDKDPW